MESVEGEEDEGARLHESDDEQDKEEIELENDETGDPFSAHFETDLDHGIASLLKEKSRWKIVETSFPELGHLQVQNLNFEPKAVKVKTLMDNEPESKLLQMQRKLISAVPE